MGSGGSRRNVPATAFPRYPSQGAFNIARPNSPGITGNPGIAGLPGPLPTDRREQQRLRDAYQTIQSYQNQLALQQGGGRTTGPPIVNPPSLSPNSFPPPSPLLQRFSGQSSYPYQQQAPVGTGGIGYRDSDYAAVANIAGLNPADVALLHREYSNLTRGGSNRLDRVVFRQLLREAMIEANNENIDRAIENIFVSIDRNHDGFIDFPEFVGAFRDVLRTNHSDSHFNSSHQPASHLINSGNQNALAQPLTFVQQPQSAAQYISIPSSNVQQAPVTYGNATPLVISLDGNHQGQQIITQPTTLQCVPYSI